MLHKVRQTSGNESVYEADPVWKGAQAIRCYGRLVATKFADGWQDKYEVNQFKQSTPEQIAQYEVLPITE